MPYRRWEKDLEVCLQRFEMFKKAVHNWSKTGGGNMLIFGFLNLNGDTTINLPPHPFVKSNVYERVDGKNVVKEKPLNEEEKKAFIQCFGKPLIVPKDLNIRISRKDFLNEVEEREHLMRDCLSWIPHSRFRHFHKVRKKGKKP